VAYGGITPTDIESVVRNHWTAYTVDEAQQKVALSLVEVPKSAKSHNRAKAYILITARAFEVAAIGVRSPGLPRQPIAATEQPR
jgi:hypothetical protein